MTTASRTAHASPDPRNALYEITFRRDELNRSLLALHQAIAREADWRQWVCRHPTVFILSALAIGFAWGRGLHTSNK